MRRIVTTAIGIVLLVFGGLLAVLLVATIGRSTWLHGRLPPDTLPANASQAADVAFSIASNAGCGEFDDELPAVSSATWEFGCSMHGIPYTIYVYGSDDARTAGLAEVRAGGRPFVAKAYYAVVVPPFETTKQDAFTRPPPPDSVLDAFR